MKNNYRISCLILSLLTVSVYMLEASAFLFFYSIFSLFFIIFKNKEFPVYGNFYLSRVSIIFVCVYFFFSLIELSKLILHSDFKKSILIVPVVIFISLLFKSQYDFRIFNKFLNISFLLSISIIILFPEYSVTPHPSFIDIIDYRQKGIFHSAAAMSLFAAFNIIILLLFDRVKVDKRWLFWLLLSIFLLLISGTRALIFGLMVAIIFISIIDLFFNIPSLNLDISIGRERRKVLHILALFFTLLISYVVVKLISFDIIDFDAISSGRFNMWRSLIFDSEKPHIDVQSDHYHNVFLDIFYGYYRNPLIIPLYFSFLILLFDFIRNKYFFGIGFYILILVSGNFDIVWAIDSGGFSSLVIILVAFSFAPVKNNVHLEEKNKIRSCSNF